MVSATALVVTQIGSPFELQSVELDSLRPDEVLVDVKATGICHTDIAVQQGKLPGSIPAILGHEGAGVVREVGSSVRDVEPGDHVVLSYNYCSSCRHCDDMKPWQCENVRRLNFGGSRLDGSKTVVGTTENLSASFFGQSSFCSPTIAAEASCIKIDKPLLPEIQCMLSCGFQTGAGAIYNVVRPTERTCRHIAVFGIGAVGCAAIMAANQLRGSIPSSETPFDIFAVDINEQRLGLAKELGATHAINSKRETPKEAIMRITSDEGVDAAIDCTGIVPVISEMIESIGAGGIAVTVGGPTPGAKVAVDVFDMLIKCKSYCGCHQGHADPKTFIPRLAELYAAGQFPLHKLQKTYAAEDVNQACQDMVNGKVVKPVLVWR